ncbi:MAG: hypothetical protein CL610_19655 [Anaerolineaceae bacterium]|nr:hypothetical protein [Anaerolineaceae bacterium]
MRNDRWLYPLIGLLLAFMIRTSVAYAHANLIDSVPPANSTLEQSPQEIRLWFTEPLEPVFSHIDLRDSLGQRVDLPSSQVDETDRHQLFIQPGQLANGIYTATWRVVSAADGHPTEGSFAFGVGTAVSAADSGSLDEAPIPLQNAVIRWANLIALSLTLGSVGFWLFVWAPAEMSHHRASIHLNRLMWVGWVSLGLTALLMLLMQVSISAGINIVDSLTYPQLGAFITTTTFGRLWLVRAVLWLAMAGALMASRRQPRALWVALLLGALVALTQSLFSHASAAQETHAAILADWLHLLATALWAGGLVALLVTLRAARQAPQNIGRLVALFSNQMRIAVAALIITGAYAAWLHVGSVEALLHTHYGQALLVKLILVVPLLGIAVINLLWTHRRLQAGSTVWARRLRGFVAIELVLVAAILVAVGVMTSGSPARGTQARRDADAAMPQPQPYFAMEIANNQMIHLEIIPGYVGENTFVVTPYDSDGQAIEDASLIRLRFDHLENNIGQSELRPEAMGDGVYQTSGANLSLPGRWRIRMTVQRPGEFDTVVDFEADITPPPAASPVPDTAIPLPDRLLALLLTSIALIVVSTFLAVRSSANPTSRITAIFVLGVGLVVLLSTTAAIVQPATLQITNAWARPMQQGMVNAVYLTIDNPTAVDEQLIGADTSIAASVELHQTQIENGISRMEPAESIAIPSGGRADIAPGGYHIMLNDLQRDLQPGDQFDLVLHFASGSSQTITIQVRDDIAS